MAQSLLSTYPPLTIVIDTKQADNGCLLGLGGVQVGVGLADAVVYLQLLEHCGVHHRGGRSSKGGYNIQFTVLPRAKRGRGTQGVCVAGGEWVCKSGLRCACCHWQYAQTPRMLAGSRRLWLQG